MTFPEKGAQARRVRGVDRRPSLGTVERLLRQRRRWTPRLALCEPVGTAMEMISGLPRTSTCRTCNRPSLTSCNPLSTFSFVWSKSVRAVATMGMLVVCSSRLASSRPMPRDAGVTSAHGCIATALESLESTDRRHRAACHARECYTDA